MLSDLESSWRENGNYPISLRYVHIRSLLCFLQRMVVLINLIVLFPCALLDDSSYHYGYVEWLHLKSKIIWTKRWLRWTSLECYQSCV